MDDFYYSASGKRGQTHIRVGLQNRTKEDYICDPMDNGASWLTVIAAPLSDTAEAAQWAFILELCEIARALWRVEHLGPFAGLSPLLNS
jgi:hypothetical protein